MGRCPCLRHSVQLETKTINRQTTARQTLGNRHNGNTLANYRDGPAFHKQTVPQLCENTEDVAQKLTMTWRYTSAWRASLRRNKTLF